MHRFFVEQKLKVGEEVKLPPDVARQIALVLRMRAGEVIALFNGDGFDYSAALAEVHPVKSAEGGAKQFNRVNKKEVRVKIVVQTENTREPKKEIMLFQALIKKDKMEWVAEKATEVGVVRIAPVIAERSVKTGINEARLRKILREAAEQSGRAKVPALGAIMDFEDALKMAMKEFEIVYLAHEAADPLQIPTQNDTRRIGLFIGPEGGFSDAEIQTAAAMGVKIISLGSTILRAETAAVVGVYRLVNNL